MYQAVLLQSYHSFKNGHGHVNYFTTIYCWVAWSMKMGLILLVDLYFCKI